MSTLLSPEEFEAWLRDGCGCHSLRVGDAVHAEYMRGIATARHYAKVAEAAARLDSAFGEWRISDRDIEKALVALRAALAAGAEPTPAATADEP